VTRARATAVMTEARATHAERMAQERAILLATVHGEVDKVAQTVSALVFELVAARRARDVAEEKIPNLAAKVATAEWQRVGVEE
jgi:hypothetical protein